MSAFFLAPSNRRDLISRANKIFNLRGFVNGRQFKLSCGELLLYPKQMLHDVVNYYQTPSSSIFCVGTLIYRSNSYSDSLRLLHQDISDDRVRYNELYGSFVVLYDDGEKVTMFTDQTGMYKLFSDKEGGFLTTSFMAATGCLQKVSFNYPAMIEQILYGFVSAPDTIVEGVIDVSKGSNNINWLNYHSIHAKTIATGSSTTVGESVEKQVDGIAAFMKSASSLLKEYGAECGLSGGCDSRLIYASVHAGCGKLNSAHTHNTSNIHKSEIEIAKQICVLNDTPLQIVPTTYLPDCAGETIEEVLKENVYYFDARNAENIGAMSYTHTRNYKRATANKNGLTFSGIGGEIYRDFYFTKSSSYSPKQWLETRIFANGARLMFKKNDYKMAVARILKKISESIGHDLNRRITPMDAKDYFCRYRIPGALANVVHANNQMSFYLAPFTESQLIDMARPDYKMQDHLGSYEGCIINCFDKRAPLIKTSKGNYNLSTIPQKLILKWKLQSRYPYFVWKIRLAMRGKNNTLSNAYNNLVKKSPYFASALAYFKSLFPSFDFKPVEEGMVPLNSLVFTICAVYELSKLNKG